MLNLQRDYYAPNSKPKSLTNYHRAGFLGMVGITLLMFGGDVWAGMSGELRSGLIIGALVGLPALAGLVLYLRRREWGGRH